MTFEFTDYDRLRFEIFEHLIPLTLFTGTEEENQTALNTLISDGSSLLIKVFEDFCKDDSIVCPYKKRDFKIKKYGKQGIHIIRIELPKNETKVDNILYAYIIYITEKDKILTYKYFLLKTLREGHRTFIIHAYKPLEKELGIDIMFGQEVTGHEDDMNYINEKLLIDFIKSLELDLINN